MYHIGDCYQDGLWLISNRAKGETRLRLFCFPYAGGGASVFRQWSKMMPRGVEVCAVQLPGHEHRINERLFSDMASLISAMVTEVPISRSMPFVFFGHSMGAKIAYALARELRRIKNIEPLHMFLSASRAPHAAEPIHRHRMDDKAFIHQICDLAGTPKAILDSKDYMSMILPVFRADFAIDETYTFPKSKPLTCPFTLFGGTEDKEVTEKDLEQWKAHTTGPSIVEIIEGDHFFIKTQRKRLTSLIAKQLQSYVPFDFSKQA